MKRKKIQKQKLPELRLPAVNLNPVVKPESQCCSDFSVSYGELKVGLNAKFLIVAALIWWVWPWIK